MPRKGITGTTAGSSPKPWPPRWSRWNSFRRNTSRARIWKISGSFGGGLGARSVNLHLAQAKCRLFPELDPEAIYFEYGLGDGQG